MTLVEKMGEIQVKSIVSQHNRATLISALEQYERC